MRRDEWRGLVERRAEALHEMRSLNQRAEQEKRNFTADEDAEFNRLEAEAGRLNIEIEAGRDELAAQRAQQNGGAAPVEYRSDGSVFRGPDDRRLDEAMRDVRKGEARALSTAASISPGELSVTLFDRLRAESVFLSTGVRVLSTDADSAVYPAITADAAPDMYAEAATITPSDPTLASVTATPRKMASLTQMSNELIDDAEPAVVPLLRDHLLKVMALKADQQLLEGSGTAPQVRGLKNVAGIQTVAAATNGQQPTFDNVADAIALLEAVNVPVSRMALIVHPRNVATLRKAKASTAGTYLWSDAEPAGTAPSTVFGVPIYTSPQLSTNETQGASGAVANSGYLFDTENVVFVRRNEITIELDRSRLFNSDQSELRGTWRFDQIVPNPTGVVRITGFLV